LQRDSIGPEAFADTQNLSADVRLRSQITFLVTRLFVRTHKGFFSRQLLPFLTFRRITIASISALACSGLQSIEISEGNRGFTISDGLLMRRETEEDREFRVLIRNFNSSPNLTIPDDVEIIGEHLLCVVQHRIQDCILKRYSTSYVPTSIQVICDRAFSECKSFSRIHFEGPSNCTENWFLLFSMDSDFLSNLTSGFSNANSVLWHSVIAFVTLQLRLRPA
jgi:hypothetical protein